MSLDSVSGTTFALPLGQQEAHTEHIWVQKETGKGFHLLTDDCSSKGLVFCSNDTAVVILLQ